MTFEVRLSPHCSPSAATALKMRSASAAAGAWSSSSLYKKTSMSEVQGAGGCLGTSDRTCPGTPSAKRRPASGQSEELLEQDGRYEQHHTETPARGNGGGSRGARETPPLLAPHWWSPALLHYRRRLHPPVVLRPPGSETPTRAGPSRSYAGPHDYSVARLGAWSPHPVPRRPPGGEPCDTAPGWSPRRVTKHHPVPTTGGMSVPDHRRPAHLRPRWHDCAR
jgi:hypothetical protein